MSGRLRAVLALLIVGGAALFVYALGEPPTPKPLPPPSNGVNVVAAVGPEAKPGVLDSAENCKRCHAEIYAEWESNYHSQAWTDELFKGLSNDYRKTSCHTCHAPRPLHETGFATAEARRTDRSSGINCLTCHKKGNHVVGSIRDPEGTAEYPADCGPVYDPDHADHGAQQTTIQYCGVCHNLHGTHEEFLGSAYAREGKTCLSCHMPEVQRPLVPGGRVRRTSSHRLPGAHSLEMLKRAMRIDVRKQGGRLRVRVVNQGAGHKIPTDARHRAIHVRVSFVDAYGAPVPVPSPLDTEGAPDKTVSMDLVRLFYRWQQIEPTQVDPLGTLGKPNERESSIEIPAGARGGKAIVRLYYLLVWNWHPETRGQLVDEKVVELDG
ncbi:MAG: multiheme c-type cytochrome [Planctomycetota bacterium]